MHLSYTFLILGLVALTACDTGVPTPSAAPETTPETSARAVQADAKTRRAEIDWDSARRDFAARDTGDDSTLTIAGSSNPPVPVLLPDQPVGIASAGGSGLQFRPTADGYFAVLPGESYDLIINGSDRLITGAVETSDIVLEDLQFQETLTGAQISFQRYGASYLAEFMCKAPITVTTGSCVTAEEAEQIVNELLISGTR